eukprot:TRINITY_DN33608_c0_g1_i1.p2 TRINITY_DN33608_c0_g1~~TRINITY_DN33608_c0_g1_i1.p2  ORF type:complete len:113 (-),score=15.88 TRINITY_DN33608_c0_g1_i1:11-349(-)
MSQHLAVRLGALGGGHQGTRKLRSQGPAEVTLDSTVLPDQLTDMMDPVPIKGTLVVVPRSLVVQWRNEVRKHAPELEVLLYTGVESLRQLHDADLVLTWYPTSVMGFGGGLV